MELGFKNHSTLKKEQEVLYGKEDTQFLNWFFCKSIVTNKEEWAPKQILTESNKLGITIVTNDYSAHELTTNQSEILLGLEHLNEWTYCKKNGEAGWAPTFCLSEI